MKIFCTTNYELKIIKELWNITENEVCCITVEIWPMNLKVIVDIRSFLLNKQNKTNPLCIRLKHWQNKKVYEKWYPA